MKVPFEPGRGDATQKQTEVKSFGYLEPKPDGFRNWAGDNGTESEAQLLVDRAATLGLTVKETTALIGGMRALDANAGGSKHGVFTETPGTLSNDFFVNLLDLGIDCSPKDDGTFEGRDDSGKVRWTATELDLVFGSNAELRAVAELYAYENAKETFVRDFVDAWTKVMTADRFDVE